jgi:hypothetical protein
LILNHGRQMRPIKLLIQPGTPQQSAKFSSMIRSAG